MASETAAEREKRLADALRRNLARRKQQARGKPPATGDENSISDKEMAENQPYFVASYALLPELAL